MKPEFENVPLVRNDVMRQFEMKIDGMKAFIEYEERDDKMFLVHAEVPLAFQGRGTGAALVEKTLVYLEEKNIALVPMCSFVVDYMRQHPEWKRILAKGINLDSGRVH